MNKYYNPEYFHKRDWLDIHIAESLKIFCRNRSFHKILDVGCGTGQLVKFLNTNGITAVGCDKYYSGPGIIKCSATKLPFPKNSFDLVTNISVIEHLTPVEVDLFLHEACRVLRPGGAIFLITPNFASPFRLLRGKKWFAYSDPTHLTYFTPTSLSHLLLKHRFQNPLFRFPISNQVDFDLHLPGFRRWLPPRAKHFLTYLLISSPLSTFRDSFWIAAFKK